MKISLSHGITVAIAVAVAITASVLVLYGVWSHTEAGLDDRMPRWHRDDMPLTVCVRSYGFTSEPRTEDVERANYVVGLINGRLGFAAYELVHSVLDCDVVLTFGAPSDRSPGAGWTDPGGYAYASGGQCVAATVNVHGELEALVVHHELGHCLGLAHDENNDVSIMRPMQVETPPRTLPPWISDFDRELLRGMYQ